MNDIRVGHGFDVHAFAENRKLIIGGVDIPYELGLAGHSDADVVLHALTDALLGAVGLGDIGDLYPDTDPQWKGADSQRFLSETVSRLNQLGWTVVNTDITIFAQVPKLGPVKQSIRSKIAEILGIPADRVNVKAKTGEKVGHIGREEALGCHAIVLVQNESV